MEQKYAGFPPICLCVLHTRHALKLFSILIWSYCIFSSKRTLYLTREVFCVNDNHDLSVVYQTSVC